ncbi:hypothetical protein BGZ54_001517, partial [Gamsiella multidivaricata]
MTDVLPLFCLVEGHSTSRAFIIDVPAAHTVANLESLIKAKRTPEFDDIAADKLTLWLVSIPVLDDEDDGEPAVMLDGLSEKKELKPTTRLSKLFPEGLPKDAVHIIVQRPPAAVPVPMKTVAYGDIGPELERIIENASRDHCNRSVDAKDVQAYQTKKLGSFYKKPLPYDAGATNLSLVMLGKVLDKEPSSEENETLHGIVEEDIDTNSEYRMVALVGPSGSGKTATVIELAKTHFVVYAVCCDPSTHSSPDFKDLNFVELAQDVEKICRKDLPKPEPRSLEDLVANDLAMKQRAEDRVNIEFLARFLFLQLLLDKNPDLEPLQFFREQINGGPLTIRKLVGRMREYDTDTICAMLSHVQDKLQDYLAPRRLGLVIALNEAQIARNRILPDMFIAPSAFIGIQQVLDDKNR